MTSAFVKLLDKLLFIKQFQLFHEQSRKLNSSWECFKNIISSKTKKIVKIQFKESIIKENVTRIFNFKQQISTDFYL